MIEEKQKINQNLANLQQLSLEIKPDLKNTFDNYITSENNHQIIAHLKYIINKLDINKLNDFNLVYLWGDHGVGKSHLLKSICELADLKNISNLYINFKNNKINNLNNLNIDLIDIFCLDNIDYITNNFEQEEILFGFYNQLKDRNNKILIISSLYSVNNLNINIADLKSRLSHGVSYKVHSLSDQNKVDLLKKRAYERGMNLTDDIAKYIISRGKRDINSLFDILDKLDQESLRHKRRLSIPFVKEILF